MIARDYFNLVERLPLEDWRELTGEKPFLVLSPHPDDESLGAGGLIALSRASGQDVTIVLMTDGSKSHPNSLKFPSDRLIDIRRAELASAARILGVPEYKLFELGLPDADAPTAGPAFERSVQVINDLLIASAAGSLFVTWRYDPHCDHEAAAVLAEELRKKHPSLKLWWYPVWGWHLPPTEAIAAPIPRGHRIAINAVLSQKRAAIEAHQSQITDLIDDDPGGFRFTAKTLAPFLRPYEYFIEVPHQ